jgi:hypothetical protein
VAANCDYQSEDFNRKAANYKDSPLGRLGKQHQSGNGEKETSWHH